VLPSSKYDVRVQLAMESVRTTSSFLLPRVGPRNSRRDGEATLGGTRVLCRGWTDSRRGGEVTLGGTRVLCRGWTWRRSLPPVLTRRRLEREHLFKGIHANLLKPLEDKITWNTYEQPFEWGNNTENGLDWIRESSNRDSVAKIINQDDQKGVLNGFLLFEFVLSRYFQCSHVLPGQHT